MKRKFCQHCVI